MSRIDLFKTIMALFPEGTDAQDKSRQCLLSRASHQSDSEGVSFLAMYKVDPSQ